MGLKTIFSYDLCLMIEKCVRNLLRFRIPVLFFILALTGLSTSYFLNHIDKADNSLPIWFEKDDPKLASYQDFVKTFGSDRFVVLGFKVPEVFSTEVLTFIRQLTGELKKIPDVDRVLSLANAEFIEGTADEIIIHPLVDEIPQNPQQWLQLKAKAFSHKDFVHYLVSVDSTVAGIVAKISTAHKISESSRLKREIENTVGLLNRNHYPFYLSGSPIVDETFNRLVVKDQRVFSPMIFLVVILVIVIFFRSWAVALTAVLLQFIVVILVLSLYYRMGYTMNVVTGMMTPILVAVCVADVVHMILEYRQGLSEGMPPSQALTEAPKNMWRPCLFTALTTLAGFLSFQASGIEPINSLGLMTALGVILAFGLTIFFIPVLLSFFPVGHNSPSPPLNVRGGRGALLNNFLAKTARLSLDKPKIILFLFVMVSALSIWGMTRLKIETNFMEYFPKSDKTRQDLEFFNQHLSGIGAYELVFSSDKPGRTIAQDPEVLKRLDRFSQAILRNPLTKKVNSHVPMVKKLNEVFHEGNRSEYKIPDSSDQIAQLLLLADSAGETELSQHKTLDNTQIRATILTQWTSSEKLKNYLKQAQKMAEKMFAPLDVDVLLTGFGPLWVEVDHRILTSQITTFLIAFLTVSLLMMFFLKSWKVGLISMIPNVLPILMTMGIMGFVKIPLSVSTLMIAGVTIGITVDDTIHYLVRLKECWKKTGDIENAILLTHQKTGKAVLFTSTILMAGFGVLCLGSFPPSVYFGSMVALTLFLSILCELLLMPVLLKYFKPFGKQF